MDGANKYKSKPGAWSARVEYYKAVVGLVVGHASDGDSRKWHLMLTNYCCKDECRFTMDWEGWMMSAKFFNKG